MILRKLILCWLFLPSNLCSVPPSFQTYQLNHLPACVKNYSILMVFNHMWLTCFLVFSTLLAEDRRGCTMIGFTMFFNEIEIYKNNPQTLHGNGSGWPWAASLWSPTVLPSENTFTRIYHNYTSIEYSYGMFVYLLICNCKDPSHKWSRIYLYS